MTYQLLGQWTFEHDVIINQLTTELTITVYPSVEDNDEVTQTIQLAITVYCIVTIAICAQTLLALYHRRGKGWGYGATAPPDFESILATYDLTIIQKYFLVAKM